MLVGCGLVGKAILRQVQTLNSAHPRFRFILKAIAESDVTVLRTNDGIFLRHLI